MKYRMRRAFSTSETLMTMGIIGLLAVTMLSMNNFSDNKVKLAHTKLIQVDSAIRAWGKAVTAIGETGVGATATIANQNTLVNSVIDYFNSSNETSTENGSTKITLDNNVELEVEYILGQDNSFFIAGATQESTQSALATIKAESKANKDESFSTDYVLLVDKLASLDDILENFSKKGVDTITEGENTSSYICLNSAICGSDKGGCEANLSSCHKLEIPEGKDVPEEIYVGNDSSSSACSNGQTGAIFKYSFADNLGTVYSLTSDECCPSPKYYNGIDENGKKVCACDQAKMAFKIGEIFAENDNCKTVAPKGTYADGNGNLKLCMEGASTGYYCDKEGLSSPILCPVGHYCPKYEEDKDLDVNNYYKNSDKEIEAEGLIAPVSCPAGTYQDKEGGLSCKPCPAGYKCPSEAMLTPIICPAGTYSPKLAADAAVGATECTPCNSPEYQDKEGQTECKKCEGAGKFTNKEEKATMCTLCKSNQYFDTASNECKTCEEPMTLNATRTSCDCPDGTYKEDNYCVSEQKVYIVTAYKLDDKHSSLTLGQNLSVFAGINAVNNWRYYGSSYHDVDKNNNEELKILLDKMTEELKNKVAYLGTAYIILEDGNLLTTAANYQIAYVNYSGWAYGSGNASADIENPNFEVINDLGMTNSNRYSTDKEEVSGGQIKYNNIVYNVAWTLFRKDTPLVLDLKGNGLKFTNVQNGVVFDLNADGTPDKTAWTDVQSEFDDAFLVFDKNSNGKIDNGKELFGNQNGASTGFEELAKYDDNNDGLITQDDASFEKLQLWCDMNKNGITDNSELKKLAEAGITELSTSVTAQYDENGNLKEDEHGNTIGLVGYFKMLVEEIVDGVKTIVETVRTMIDVLFNTITL